MNSQFNSIPIDQIDFDRENPRIKVALEKYGDKLDDQRIRFALQTATEGSESVASYRSLKDSVRASKGISVPITVRPDDARYICIDGNTRLTIFHELREETGLCEWDIEQLDKAQGKLLEMKQAKYRCTAITGVKESETTVYQSVFSKLVNVSASTQAAMNTIEGILSQGT